MVVDILSFLEGKIIYLIIFLVVLLILIIVLFLIHKRLKASVVLKEEIQEKEGLLQNEVEKFESSNKPPIQILDEIDKFTRNLIREVFKVNKRIDYGEMVDYFKHKKKANLTLLSQQLLNALYSGEKVEKKNINQIIKTLKAIIDEENLYPKTTIEKPLQESFPTEKEVMKSLPKQKVQQPEPGSYLKTLVDKKRITESKIIKDKIEFNLPAQMQKQKMMKQLNSLDDEQINDAYKQLQEKYEEAYQIAEQKNDKSIITKLEMYKESLTRTIQEYAINHNIIPLSREISRGVRLLSSITG